MNIHIMIVMFYFSWLVHYDISCKPTRNKKELLKEASEAETIEFDVLTWSFRGLLLCLFVLFILAQVLHNFFSFVYFCLIHFFRETLVTFV